MAPHPQHAGVASVLILAILVDVQWYLIAVLISLMTYDIEHIFICLFAAICNSSLVRCLFTSVAYFNWVFICCIF